MKETEITVQVFDSYENIRKILENKGYFAVKEYYLTDWYFTKFASVKGLDYPFLLKNSFIVRENTENGKSASCLCFKDKVIDKDGIVVAEEKTQTALASATDAVKVLTLGGLNNYCIVENHSFAFEKDGIGFALQIIKDLGIFIEWEEDESIANLSAEEKIATLKERVNALGLQTGWDYSCKKVFMLVEKSNG